MATGIRSDRVRRHRSRPGKSWRGKDAPTLGAGRLRRAAVYLLAAAALWLGVDAGWLHAKAWLAQQLLQAAWADTQVTQRAHKPWPWADTTPVARLRAPRLSIDQIVLAGDAGRTLAFGPGWAEASATPGMHGAVVLSGHRDTHFAFLRELQPGDELQVDASRATRRYRVVSMHVADTRRDAIALREDDDALLLVTCWPFEALAPGGPLRYVVRAEPLPAEVAAQAQARRDSATITPSPSA
ncbi:MAG: class GN sortase [Chiayiivirga sp.]|jgi:sortase A|nr:class GN sortase [Chiayiivirga sp.]